MAAFFLLESKGSFSDNKYIYFGGCRFAKHIGQRTRKIRKAHNLSQKELAERIGISTTHMSHIETGNTKLSLPVFVDLAAALEVRTDELLYDSDSAVRSASIEEIVRLLDTCTTQQVKLAGDFGIRQRLYC